MRFSSAQTKVTKKEHEVIQQMKKKMIMVFVQ